MIWLAIWLSGNALVSINVVAIRRARLVPGWVTVFGRVNYISVCKQPPRSTQPVHPSVGRRSEYQLRLGCDRMFDVSLAMRHSYRQLWFIQLRA